MCSEASKVLLAETWSEDVDPTGWWMSEKLDGVRAYWNGKNFYSRQGNLFHVPDFFKAALPKVALDGEIWCGRGLFQKCVSIVKKQANKVVPDDYKLLTYLIFDAPTQGGKYEDRVKWLQANIPQDDDKCFATVVGIKKCEGLAQLKQYLADVNKAGGEGIMLRKPGSLYEHKRSTTLLKVKTFYDEEAYVIGHKPSKSLIGMTGALECELPNGKRFDVGSGLTMDQRRKPPKIGSVITFKFQELSNNGHPRFPTFLRVRTDLTWNDVLEAAKTKKPVSTIQKIVPSGKRFDVGSGLTMDQRRKPPKIGSVITFKFQELSNNGHPRFPTFLRVRTDLTWNDVLEAAKTKKPVSTIQKIVPSAKLSKQHSILFSVVPSRDATTNKKIVTSDDEDDDAPSTTSSPSKTTDTRKICQYGAKCYRTNADHLKNFQHPSSTPTKTTQPESTTKPVCTFGAKCFRTSSVHLATYSHPPKSETKDTTGEDEALDTRELMENEEPASPTTTDNLLAKDKNKGLTFDDDDEESNQDQEMVTRPRKDWINLENKVNEQTKRLAHLEEIFKKTKRSNSTNDDNQDNVKRPKTD
ncbi:unnamed protein product [Adineta steineri]|uniref:DNA ligase n=1 Tax=Adineta steineri TaxID=433720 RepID=A0A814MVG2_9BILA|nr:unnamed protein product [Adineta steineri]